MTDAKHKAERGDASFPNPLYQHPMFDLILNADVYAPAPLGRQHVLVCAGKIVYIGETVPTLDEALGVRTTDLEGRRLMPGRS